MGIGTAGSWDNSRAVWLAELGRSVTDDRAASGTHRGSTPLWAQPRDPGARGREFAAAPEQTSLVAPMVRTHLPNRKPGFNPESGRSPGEGYGNPLQDSCLQNPMDRGALWATVHWIAKSEANRATSPFSLYKLDKKLCPYTSQRRQP